MRYLLTSLILLCVFSSFSQTDKDSVEVVNEKEYTFITAPKVIKFSPFDIFSYYPTLGVDIEAKVRHNKSIQVGSGIIPPFLQFNNGLFNQYDNIGGYKLRAEGRLYRAYKTNQYISLGIGFRHLIIKDEIAVGMERSVNNMGQEEFAYFINTNMLFHRLTKALEFKYGFQRTTYGGLVVDMYLGLSIRSTRTRTSSKIPEGGTIPQNFNGLISLSISSFTYPTPIVGLKLGFNKKKKEKPELQ